MAAKISPNGLRFFAHLKRNADCPGGAESVQHVQLKTLVATAAREAGRSAELEAVGDGFRADVLTEPPGGERKIAWEIQRSHIHPDEVRERTSRHEAAGLETVWLPARPWRWTKEVTSLLVSDPPADGRPWTAASGSTLAWTPTLDLRGYYPTWTLAGKTSLAATVRRILDGELTYTWCRGLDLETWHDYAWAPRQEVDDWLAHAGDLPKELPARVCIDESWCYRCRRRTLALVGIDPFDPNTGQTFEHIDIRREGRHLLQMLPALLRQAGHHPSPHFPVGVIKRRHSQARGRTYLSNGRYWCDTLLGDWYLEPSRCTAPDDTQVSTEPTLNSDETAPIVGPLPISRLRAWAGRRPKQILR